MSSFRDIIRAWPDRQTFAADVGVDVGLVKQWERRDSIPARHWNAVVAHAEKRALPVTLEILAELAARQQAA